MTPSSEPFKTTLGEALKAAHRVTELVAHNGIAGLGHDVREVYRGTDEWVTFEVEDGKLFSFAEAQEIVVDAAGEAVIHDADGKEYLIGFEMVRPLAASDLPPQLVPPEPVVA